MNENEKELQRIIEEGGSLPDDLDARSYREVFRILKTDPDYGLAPGLAERVAKKVIERQKARDLKDYLWFFVGLAALLFGFVGTVMYTGFRIDMGFLSSMADYKGLAVFALLFVAFLHWMDKRLITGRQNS